MSPESRRNEQRSRAPRRESSRVKRTVELRDDARPLLGALLVSLGFDLDAVVHVNRLESDNGFIFMQ
jgi:hypothetical protein